MYESVHVNALLKMVRRHLSLPFRFICVTDDPVGLDKDVEFIPIETQLAGVPSLLPGRPGLSCFRRLRLFAPDAEVFFGERVLSIDLDMVLTQRIDPLIDRQEDFIICKGFTDKSFYNGSMFLHRCGTMPYVWDDFNPDISPELCAKQGLVGSDQAWISYRLGQGRPTWTHEDGVYSFRIDVQPKGQTLPANAKVISFHGKYKPWGKITRRDFPWVREYYPRTDMKSQDARKETADATQQDNKT